MEAIPQTSPAVRGRPRLSVTLAGVLIVILIAGAWVWRNQSSATDAKSKPAEVIPVITAVVKQSDVPVRLTANGTVSAQQTVAVRPQLSAAIRSVNIKEGQFVRKGERLFTLDARTEDANLSKTEGQLAKSRADLRNAERNLERQRELFRQNFISQAALDVAENQVDAMRGQLAVDQATVQANLIARGFSEITAPIAGRTGAISVYQGSLVQPNDALVSITQVDPINVSFTLPEREFVPLEDALAKGDVMVNVELDAASGQMRTGRLIFIDNMIDTASGTIRLKAEFPNADSHLWPGMFVTVSLAPRTLTGALTVPVQAVQTGPERKFLYVVDSDNKVNLLPVNVRLVQDEVAIVEGDGIAPEVRVIMEGAQNLRPGSVVREAKPGKEAKPGGSKAGVGE
ncbi:efflux RND transporter periplasmic adaptor subunit [Nitrosovibrio tenuis]|uniref:RND family efflux transporter, MFP subunit n=1 Tax=Nitrosovibrio tenuis TaxID=1233 RepID=A0A1H7PYR5_9PROT|nr:efflux RND transporter periplasmic adaptor subunit [Nitrosovibrio tenuis]SEL40970.1 RND family efflux transporter, MFP subunit [Nitrosovibrio tenuis]